jgi:hypothetical protein
MSQSSEDVVWLTVGPEYDDGEFISRMRMPDDAIRAALEIDGSHVEGGEARMYEVWTIER